MDWTSGYVADIGYTVGFYPEMTPSHMAFAALSVARSPGRALRAERYLELGFGQGFGLALLAAANPQIACEGCDFNPEHVAHVQDLIKGAGLANLKVGEGSFEEVALRGGENDVDAIALHGIFSWVSRQAQEAIVAIARQRLAPNGLLYVSYNCMPGWAPLMPIRQFMREVKRRNPGRSSERQVALGLDLIGRLKDGHAGYFNANPAAVEHLQELLQQNRVYLAHEYLDEHWDIFPFSDMAARLAEAKLSYVCSATLPENLDAYAVPQALAPLVAETDDPVMRETIRDYASNKRFRRDVFARGSATISAAEHRRVMSELRFALAVPRDSLSFKFMMPTGEVTGISAMFEPVADLLAGKIAGFDELLALPCFGNERFGNLVDCLTLLVASGQAVPIMPAAAGVDLEPARRFNRMIVERIRTGHTYWHLAAPVAGTGIAVRDLDLMALAALFDGRGDDAAMAAKHTLAQLRSANKLPVKDGKLLRDEAEGLAFLEEKFTPILDNSVPIWRRLGVL
jgi:SAM-dependent methyltransferase